MSAPRPHVDVNTYDQRADEPIADFVRGRPFTLQGAQEARQAYEDCREVALRLSAQVAALREALRGTLETNPHGDCWCDNGHAQVGSTCYGCIARAALAMGESDA